MPAGQDLPSRPWWAMNGSSSGGVPADDDHPGCSYSTVQKYNCKVVLDADGKPSQQCERIRQLLRHCPGRPTEVLESSKEVEDGAPGGALPNWPLLDDGPGNTWDLERPKLHPFGPKYQESGPPSERDALLAPFADLFGGPHFLDDMVRAAEDLMDQLGIDPRGGPSGSGWEGSNAGGDSTAGWRRLFELFGQEPRVLKEKPQPESRGTARQAQEEAYAKYSASFDEV